MHRSINDIDLLRYCLMYGARTHVRQQCRFSNSHPAQLPCQTERMRLGSLIEKKAAYLQELEDQVLCTFSVRLAMSLHTLAELTVPPMHYSDFLWRIFVDLVRWYFGADSRTREFRGNQGEF